MAYVTSSTLRMDGDDSGLKRTVEAAEAAVKSLSKELNDQAKAGKVTTKAVKDLRAADALLTKSKKNLERETKKATAANKRFAKSARDAKQATDNYGSSLAKAVTGLKGLVAAAGVGIALRGVTRVIQDAAQLGVELTAMSKAVNASVEVFQGLDKVVRDVGGTTEQMTQAMSTLNVRAGEAARGADNAFRQLGVTIEGGPVAQLREIAGILESLPEEQRLTVSSQFFGEEGGRIMVAALAGGMEDVAARLEEAIAGAQVSTQQAAELASINVALQDIADTWRNSLGGIVALNSERLIAGIEGLSGLLERFVTALLGVPVDTWRQTGYRATQAAGTVAAATTISAAVIGLGRLIKGSPLKVVWDFTKAGFGKAGWIGLAAGAVPIAYEAFLKEQTAQIEDDFNRLLQKFAEFDQIYGDMLPGEARGRAVRNVYRDLLVPAAIRANMTPFEYLMDPAKRPHWPGGTGPGPRPPGRGGLPPPPWPPPKGLFSELRDYIVEELLPGSFEGARLDLAGSMPLPELPPYPDFRMADPGKMEMVAQAARDQAMAEGGLARELSLLTDAQLESMIERAGNITDTYDAAQELKLRLTGETHTDWDVVRTFQNASDQASNLFDTMVTLESDIARASSEGRGRAAFVLREELQNVRAIYNEVVKEIDLPAAERAASDLIQTYLKLGDLARQLIAKREMFDAIYQSVLLLGGVGFQVDPVTPEGKSAIELTMEKRDQVKAANDEAKAAAQATLQNRVARTENAFRGLADALFRAADEAVTLGETMRQFFFNLLRDFGSELAGNFGREVALSLFGDVAAGQATGGSVPGLATGGYAPGGWAMVGEMGPELVNFATPARVYSNQQLGQALRGGGQTNVTVSFQVAAGADARAFRAQAPTIAETIRGVVEEAATRPGRMRLALGGT